MILTSLFRIRGKTEADGLGSMSGSNYREKEGGARLGAVRQNSLEGAVAWGTDTRATTLRSVGIKTGALSSTVPAAHIQEQSRVPCVAA